MKQFKKVYVEITNICNLSCDFCPKSSRKLEFMSVKTFSKILDQIKPHTNYIYLHVKGEPLLHPSLDKLLDISFEKGFNVNITTNGTLINQTKEILLSKPAVRQINFSLHSLDGNKDSKIFKDYISNILSFTKEASQNTKIFTSLRLWNLNASNETSNDNRKNQTILESIEKEFNLNFKINESTELEKGLKIADRIYVNQGYAFKWPDLEVKEENKVGFCHALRTHAAILVDGTVIPCCLDGEGIINLGNINQTNFTEIINSPRAQNIINGFSNKKPVEKLCQKCGFMTRF